MIKFGKTLLIVGLLLLGLTGCGQLKADIPHHIVTAAVERQAQQNQVDLWRQLSADADTVPRLSVNHVRVEQVRRVKVVDELAYEVTGTYRYKLRYPQRSPLQPSQVPFSLILQTATETTPWQLLEFATAPDRPQAWHWQPLTDGVA